MKGLVVLEVLFICTTIAEFGPFRYVVKEVMECEGIENEKIHSLSGTKISKFNRTVYIYNTTAHFKEPLSDDLSMLLTFARWGNGGWKYNYNQLDFEKMCESIKTFSPQIFYQFMNHFKFPDCPIPPGTYELINFQLPEFSMSNVVPYFEYGRYKVYAIVNKEEKTVGCKGFIIDFVPDKAKKKKG